MKAILVIDMPKCCSECDLIDNVTGNCLVGIVDGYDYENIRKGCPLKPIPNHLPTPYLFRQMQIADGLQNSDGSVPVYSEDYMNGWNDCIDELLGEGE